MLLDREPPMPPLTAAQIRAFYERNRTQEVYALSWEVWRLQCCLVDLLSGLEKAQQLRRGVDILNEIHSLREAIVSEPCVAEMAAMHSRGRRTDPSFR